MQSFYLTNSNFEENSLSILNKQLMNYPKLEIKNFSINFFHSSGKESFYKNGQNFISNLGVFIYKNNYNKNSLKMFLDDLLSGKSLKDLLLSNDTRGQFCLILYFNNQLKIISDRLGYFPVYIYQKSSTIAFSSSMLMLGKNNKTSLNYIGIGQYLSENYKYITYACCDQNIFNEIHYMEAGTVYSIDGESIKKEKYFDIKDQLEIGKYQTIDEIVSNAENLLTNNLSFLKNINGKIHCDITGGVDTRVIIATLSKLGIKYSVGVQAIKEYEDFSNQGKFSELNIVNKIIKYKDLDFRLFSDENYLKNEKTIDDITFFHSHKQTYNRRAGYFSNVKENGADIMISGLSGTELFRLSYNQYFKKNNNLNLDTFLAEHVELVDLLHDKFLTKESYFDHLKKFYNENISGVKFNKAKDLSSYIDYFAFYRTHFCRYLSLANSFLPFYTPYGDYPFANFMYQVSHNLKNKFKIQRFLLTKLDPKLASFYSTRGFPLSKVNFLNFYKFSRMISNDVPQQYFSLNQRLSSSAKKILIKHLFKNKNIYYSFFRKKLKNIGSRKNLWNTPDNLRIIDDLDAFVKKDLPIFEIVDKKKVIKYTNKDCNYNIIDRVSNLNRILEYTNH
jgi:hypothetical protein